eukprot:scaffold251483_cov18-Tisochrysis_lutea.AAC.1
MARPMATLARRAAGEWRSRSMENVAAIALKSTCLCGKFVHVCKHACPAQTSHSGAVPPLPLHNSGYDGKTYSNACKASCKGVEVKKYGECSSSCPPKDTFCPQVIVCGE